MLGTSDVSQRTLFDLSVDDYVLPGVSKQTGGIPFARSPKPELVQF